MTHDPATVRTRAVRDQARLPTFRLLLALQLVVAFFFGLGPLVVPEAAGILLGYPADEHVIYRIAGAATLGYAVMAALGLRRPTWQGLRIPMVATLTFNAAAVVAVLLTLLTGGPGQGGPAPMLVSILAAGTLFSIVAAYWLARNEGADRVEDRTIDPYFRMVLTAATIAAGIFGLAPLLLPEYFATIAGLDASDVVVYRFAGAATLGYAVAGLLEIRAAWWHSIRIQNGGAIVFNALSAVAAALYFQAGGQSPIVLLILIAASLFAVALGSWQYRLAR